MTDKHGKPEEITEDDLRSVGWTNDEIAGFQRQRAAYIEAREHDPVQAHLEFMRWMVQTGRMVPGSMPRGDMEDPGAEPHHGGPAGPNL